MNEKQLNDFMAVLSSEYAKLHNLHMQVIKDYMNEYLTFDDYKRKDLDLTARLETQKSVIDSFLKIKEKA